MSSLKLHKVSETININRYDNGWMVEANGRDNLDNWKNQKIVCNTEQEVIDLVKALNKLPLDQ
jgi:hypothetical protein